MNANLAKALRRGGLSRRGFLRALGVTAASALVPGLGLYPVYRSGTRYVGGAHLITVANIKQAVAAFAASDDWALHAPKLLALCYATARMRGEPCP